MDSLPILLIADESVPEALGSKLTRGAESLGLRRDIDFQTAYTSPSTSHSKSMKHIYGKIYYRINDKRSWEWNSFQRKLIEEIKAKKPRLVIVTGILPMTNSVIDIIHYYGGYLVNYLTDDPWNSIHRRRSFLSNLNKYNHIFTTKKQIIGELGQAGVSSISWLPFAYDPVLHHKPIKPCLEEAADIHFIGTGAKERLDWLTPLSNITTLSKRVYGNNWENINPKGWEKRLAVTGEQYCNAIHDCKIVLGLLRRANRDDSTDRSYEIGAIGGCGIYEDTEEHRKLLNGYPDIGFFKTPSELQRKVKMIVANKELQQQLKSLGRAAVMKEENTYKARLKTIIEVSKI